MSTYVNINTIDNKSLAIIEFYNPKGNSLPSYMLDELIDKLKLADKDENVKVILIKSKGEKAFCAGASFDELLEIDDYDIALKFFSGFANLINTIRKLSKFVIVEVQSKVIGGGVGLVAACDYSYATVEASIKLSELSLGIGPFVIAPAVQRKIGVAAMSELTINAEDWRSATWAHDRGLFYSLSADKEIMQQESNALIERLTKYSAEAMIEVKLSLWEGTSNWDETLIENAKKSAKLVLSKYTKSKLEEFKKK